MKFSWLFFYSRSNLRFFVSHCRPHIDIFLMKIECLFFPFLNVKFWTDFGGLWCWSRLKENHERVHFCCCLIAIVVIIFQFKVNKRKQLFIMATGNSFFFCNCNLSFESDFQIFIFGSIQVHATNGLCTKALFVDIFQHIWFTEWNIYIQLMTLITNTNSKSFTYWIW